MGGHGGLNILPQKSWNVYNVKNIERVRRDEQRHQRKVEEAERKARQAEQEERLEVLRRKNGIERSAQHINFFEEEQKNQIAMEKEARRKAEVERERQHWLWKFGAAGKVDDEWFMKKDSKKRKRSSSESDPLNDINSMLKRDEAKNEDDFDRHKRRSRRKHRSSSTSEKIFQEDQDKVDATSSTNGVACLSSSKKPSKSRFFDSETEFRKQKDEKRSKRKKEKERRKKEKDEARRLLKKMQAERDKREKCERERTEKMLHPQNADVIDEEGALLSHRHSYSLQGQYMPFMQTKKLSSRRC